MGGAPNHSRYFGGSTQEPRGTWSRLPSGTDSTATRAHSLSAGLLSKIQGDQAQLWQTEANPNTSIPKVLVQFKSLSHHSSLHQFSLLSHFYTSFFFFHVSHAAPKHKPPHFLVKKWGLEVLPSQTGYYSYKVLPRGLFFLAEIATSCLFSPAETPLQIQRGFTEVSDVRSAGTSLPTSSPGLQLSQGEEAVYQHTGQWACRAAALLNHTAPQLAQLSYGGNSTFTVPNKRWQPAKQHTNLLLSPGRIHSADCPQQSLTVREITWAAPFTRRTPSASQEQNMAPVSQKCSACLQGAQSCRPWSIPQASQEIRSCREKLSEAAAPPGQRGREGRLFPARQSVLPPPPLLQLSPEQESPVTHSLVTHSVASQGCQHRAEPASRLLISKKSLCLPMLPGWGHPVLKRDSDSFSSLAHVGPKLPGPKGPWKYQSKQTYTASFQKKTQTL